MIVRWLPYRRANRPKASAPKNAMNWTSRMVMISTWVSNPSCFSPYVEETEMTVWMPSLKNRYATRNSSVIGYERTCRRVANS